MPDRPAAGRRRPGSAAGARPSRPRGSRAVGRRRPGRPAAKARPVLRISADPNNLPVHQRAPRGVREQDRRPAGAPTSGPDPTTSGGPSGEGSSASALKEDEADLVLGVPAGFERALTTAPYYRSTYVFATAEGPGAWRSARSTTRRFADLKVGVQLIGDDGINTPPAHALAARGMVDNVVGFTVYGDYAEENPPARIVEAVGKGEVDVAVVWGPLAGYFARRLGLDLDAHPGRAGGRTGSGLPLAFDIGMGVRKEDKDLKRRIDEVLVRRGARRSARSSTTTGSRGSRPAPAGPGRAMRVEPLDASDSDRPHARPDPGPGRWPAAGARTGLPARAPATEAVRWTEPRRPPAGPGAARDRAGHGRRRRARWGTTTRRTPTPSRRGSGSSRRSTASAATATAAAAWARP